MNDWSKIAEEARAATAGPGIRCQVEALLKHLGAEDAGSLVDALSDEGLTHAGIFRAIRSRLGTTHPLTPSLWSIGNHRRGNCRCGR